MTALGDWAFCALCGTRLSPPAGDLKPACPACGWFRATYAQPVVLVLAHNDEDQVLFARRDAWPAGAWALIAGFIEAGETAEAAALRELAEEAQVVGREPRVRRTVVRDDLLLVCVEVAFTGQPRAGSDVDEVLLSAPDPDLVPEGWEARTFVEEYARDWSATPSAAIPSLVVVGGAPGSGKTTLATRLSRELNLPLLTKDRIKESLMESLGVADLRANQQIGAAAYDLLFEVTGWLLEAGSGCVIESNFVAGGSEASLGALVQRAAAVQIHCVVDEQIRRSRYEDRARTGERHPGHLDDAVLREWAARPARRHGPLSLDTPMLVVDTDRGYQPTIAEIVAFCTRAAAPRDVLA